MRATRSREVRWLLLREVGLVAIGLSAIALLAFGPHIHHGGFYSDDWANAADYRFDEQIQAGLGLRYLLLLLLPVPHAVFGLDASDHLLLASALAVSSAGAFYVVLRLLRFERVHAFAISALVLVFPGVDSLRLWATAGVNSLSVTLFLAGLAIALRASRRTGRRGWLLHFGAQLLYVGALLLYEAVLPIIALSVVFYVQVAEPRELAIKRWRADLVLVATAVIALLVFSKRDAGSVLGLLRGLVLLPLEGVAELGHSLLPVGLPDVAAAVAAAAVATLIGRAALRVQKPLAATEARWLGVVMVGAVLLVASHLMFVGSGLGPLSRGTGNRGNLISAHCYTVVAYGMLMLSVGLARQRHASLRRIPEALSATFVAAVLATGYVMSIRADAEKWDRASHEQERVLSALQASVRAPAEGQTLFVFGAPARAAAGIPIFAEAWDLDGAARIIYDEPSIAAYPIFGRVRMVCSRRSVFPFTESSTGPDSDPWGPAQGAAYGKAVFVDVQNRRAEEISNRSECQMARRRFKPGARYLPH